ncbi:hypothetical protein [Christiangramia sp. SM2212]|uniref:Outer membrane protein beta-barrel domain-containing protein n=1 Tax=Christiangramia sediminicola TaxID=3073267 RepID=A0ABU1ELG7_9FLAO|nr:hypothetical protein [Christiangramia sp. SM2212]MDR5589222.1 hypothetical protein [Christiangramia sp. SM2212]
MKKIFLLLLLILPIQAIAQYWISREDTYFFVSTGLDLRNATFGGTVNPAAYDGTWTAGYRNENFGIHAYYETFSAIRYESAGVNPEYIFRPGKMLIPVADISLSFIRRPWKVYPSLAMNVRMEYHFSRFFVYVRGESRWRTDYDFFQFSVYGGVSFKFGFPK